MAVGARSDSTARVRSRRVYSAYGTRFADNPLDTLLRLVALNDVCRVPDERFNASRDDLKEVISALYRVATGNFDTTQVLTFAASRACSMTGATGAVIALKQGGEFVSTATAGDSAPALGARFSSDTGISGECVRTASILRCDDTENDVRVNARASRALGIRSLVAVPIFGRGEVVGLLEVFGARPEAFEEERTYLLQLVSALVSHALENEMSADAVVQDTVSPTGANCQVQEPASISLSAIHPAGSWIEDIRSRRFGLGLRIAAGLVVSAALFAGLWVAIPRNDTTAAQNRQTIASTGRIASTSLGKAAGAAGTTDAQDSNVPARISGVEFKSHGDFTAVKINLDHWIKQESGRLRNPNRIYFDLFDSDLGGKFQGERATTINLDDPYIERIRMAQDPQHRTRVVLDLKCACEYSAVLPDHAPYELSILVQPPQHMSRGALLRSRASAVATASSSGQARTATQ